MPRLSVGEISIHHLGQEYLFRPSFSALDKIGSPQEITQAFVDIQLANPEKPKWHEIALALQILQACCSKDIFDICGHMAESKSGLPKFKFKKVPANDLIVFARHLMICGVYGKPKKQDKTGGDNNVDFEPIQFVTFAAQHLNKSMAEAWDLTMIEFQALYDATFPEQKQEATMTADEIDELEAAIKQKKGLSNG